MESDNSEILPSDEPTLILIRFNPTSNSDVDAESYLDDYFTTYHGVERVGKFVCTS